jgi:hypothetical protein
MYTGQTARQMHSNSLAHIGSANRTALPLRRNHTNTNAREITPSSNGDTELRNNTHNYKYLFKTRNDNLAVSSSCVIIARGQVLRKLPAVA